MRVSRRVTEPMTQDTSTVPFPLFLAVSLDVVKTGPELDCCCFDLQANLMGGVDVDISN
jgi:hypothetical protein